MKTFYYDRVFFLIIASNSTVAETKTTDNRLKPAEAQKMNGGGGERR
jgi:hypothetical protein